MFNLIYKWTDKIKSKVAELSKKLGEKGQGVTEYALILAAIAAIAIFAIYGTTSTGEDGTTTTTGLKASITGAFTRATGSIDSAQ